MILARDGSSEAAGVWHEIRAGAYAGRAALFVDRDGVILEDSGYLGRADGVRLLPGAADAVAQCNRLAIPVVVVTNQSGIARGYYDWDGFHAVQKTLAGQLAAADARLDAVFACAHHAEGTAPLNVADHHWRKPAPGMILAAGRLMQLDLAGSWIVGDRISDIAAGRAAGLAGGILLSALKAPDCSAATAQRTESFAVETRGSLADAVALLLERGRLGAVRGELRRTP